MHLPGAPGEVLGGLKRRALGEEARAACGAAVESIDVLGRSASPHPGLVERVEKSLLRAEKAVGPYRDLRGEDRFGASERSAPRTATGRESPRPERARAAEGSQSGPSGAREGLAEEDQRLEQIVRSAERRYGRSALRGRRPISLSAAKAGLTDQPSDDNERHVYLRHVESVHDHLSKLYPADGLVDQYRDPAMRGRDEHERVEDDSRDGPEEHAALYDPDDSNYWPDGRGYPGDPLTVGRGSPAPQGGEMRDDLETAPSRYGDPSSVNVSFVYNKIKRDIYEYKIGGDARLTPTSGGAGRS